MAADTSVLAVAIDAFEQVAECGEIVVVRSRGNLDMKAAPLQPLSALGFATTRSGERHLSRGCSYYTKPYEPPRQVVAQSIR
jgi:hypothetical protein